MKVLVTGACGFVGQFLHSELLQGDHLVYGFDVQSQSSVKNFAGYVSGDITDATAVSSCVQSIIPDACIHLAGIASPPIGRLHPEKMLNTNILGTANILEALHNHATECRFLLASTAYVYGSSSSPYPLTETSPLRPNGIYAVSKAAADLMTLAYAEDYGMHTMTARAANHTGPGQTKDFVVPAFAEQIAAIADGLKEPVMKVGNLDSERSFLDVRDVVRAYRLLVEHGKAGKAYNVSSAERVPIRMLLSTLSETVGIQPRIEIDKQRYRPTDKTPLLDTTLITEDTGWKQNITLQRTLLDVLENIRS